MTEKIRKESIMGKVKTKIAASATALALMATMSPALALATVPSVSTDKSDTNPSSSNNTASTLVYLQADDSKIIASVPTKVALGVKGDGEFIPPTSGFTVENGSQFGIYVSNVKLALTDSFTSDSKNKVTLNLTPGSASSATQLTVGDSGNTTSGSVWNISKKNGETNGSLTITPSGKLENISSDLSSETQFGTLTWTFKAGSLSDQAS
jgi:hypothetical protein